MEITPATNSADGPRSSHHAAPGAAAVAAVVTLRGGEPVAHRAQLQAILGVSGETAGAVHLSLNLVTIPPGAAARPHRHDGVETAVYVVSGEIETRYGPALDQRAQHRAGDFVFIPPGVPHQPTNLSQHVPAVAVVAHSTGDEQASIIWHDVAVAPEATP